MSHAIVWLRNDLRLSDNPALYHAAQHTAFTVVYIRDRTFGAAQEWWLHQSLADLQKRGLNIVLRSGKPEEVLQDIVKHTHATHLYWNRAYEPHARRQQARVKQALEHLHVETYNASLLFSPEKIANKQGGYFKVFTPFWKHCLSMPGPKEPLPAPEIHHARMVESETLESWKLCPTAPDWAGGLREMWQPGELHAQQRLYDFLDHSMLHYASHRDRPDCDHTSRLSPYLHFGEISPRQIWHVLMHRVLPAEKFLSELGWREFSYHLLHHMPTLPEKPFRPEFEAFPWREDARALTAWQRGMTGYPIIDAGMRQLWHTGWMHNRVRMLVASFLTKSLMIPWQEGAAWFWDTLVDADCASNSASWQWVAGCGADAAPYFRIFNPVLQGEKFDPDGSYVRQWVPELRTLPDSSIHKPWEVPPMLLREYGCVLGKDYPHPIVDHAKARNAALAAYKEMKGVEE